MSNLDNYLFESKMINRKTYIFDDTSYYKVIGLNSQYYIKVSDLNKITLHQMSMTLYKHTASSLVKVKAYVKSLDYSDILFIAAPTISSPFKMYDLEKRD